MKQLRKRKVTTRITLSPYKSLCYVGQSFMVALIIYFMHVPNCFELTISADVH